MEATVGYFDAWIRWATSGPLDPRLELLGLPVFWWSRIGKLLTFIGGATVILDLIGPKRADGLARSLPVHLTLQVLGGVCCVVLLGGIPLHYVGVLEAFAYASWPEIVTILVVGAASSVVAVALVMGGILTMAGVSEGVWSRYSVIFLRGAAYFVLLIGFHFDILAS